MQQTVEKTLDLQNDEMHKFGKNFLTNLAVLEEIMEDRGSACESEKFDNNDKSVEIILCDVFVTFC
jgi:hypothetical protein